MKFILTSLLLLCVFSSTGQNFFISLFGGFSNYSGDLQSKRFTLDQSRPAYGGGLLYELNDNLYIRAGLTVGKITADDKKGKNIARNLNFSTVVTEYHLGLEYQFFSLYENPFTPYVFAGIARFDFNPQTKNSNGDVVFLSELNTEGQGFYKDRKVYKLKQVSLPFGAGIKYSINKNKRIGFEIGIRKTFTDYLDDVSTTYVDQALLASHMGTNSVNAAYRGAELPNGLPYPADGTQRGNPKNKDWYYFAGLTASFRLVPHYRKREVKVRKSRTTCPKL